MKFLTLIVLMSLSSIAMAAHHKITCTGESIYGDVKWKTVIRVYGQRALISHSENEGMAVATEAKIEHGRVMIPCPDGAMDAFLYVAHRPLRLELYDRATHQRLPGTGTVDAFKCR